MTEKEGKRERNIERGGDREREREGERERERESLFVYLFVLECLIIPLTDLIFVWVFVNCC